MRSNELPGSPLPPPQFRLRSLLLLLTLCGGVLALTQWLPPLTVVAIGFLLLCMGAHVAGNALGTRMRQPPREKASAEAEAKAPRARLDAEHFAPPTRLRESHSPGWPLLVATLIGLVGGGALGGYWVILSSPQPPAELNIAVGVVAYGVLGGIFSFIGVGFLQVGGAALRQALQITPKRRDG